MILQGKIESADTPYGLEAEDGQGQKNTGLAWFLLFSAIGLSVYLVWILPNPLSGEEILLSLAIVWLGLVPSFQYLLDADAPPMPFMPLVGIFYAVSYGVSNFFEGVVVWRISGLNHKALVLVIAGLICLYASFYTSKRSLWRAVTPVRLPRAVPLNFFIWLSWLLLSTRIAIFFFPGLKDIPSMNQLLEPVVYFGYGIFFILYCRGYLNRFQKIIFLCGVIPFDILYRLTSGLLSQVMLLVLFLSLMHWYEKRKISITFAFFIVFSYLFFIPAKAEYRNLTWNSGGMSQLNLVEKAKLFWDLNYVLYTEPQNREKAFERSPMSRIAYAVLFSAVVDRTPETVPYWNGETYKPLLSKVIPRAIWPDKPLEVIGGHFGHRYGFIQPTDTTTSVNLPWLIEMYANFGTWGVLVGMGLLGFLFAFLEMKFNRNEMSFLEFILGTTVLFRLINQESNFSLLFGNTVQVSLFLYLLICVCIVFSQVKSSKI